MKSKQHREFTEAVRELAKLAGWNVQRLAAEMLIVEKTAYNWLNGDTMPSAAMRQRVRQLLDRARKAETSQNQSPIRNLPDSVKHLTDEDSREYTDSEKRVSGRRR